MYKLSYMSLAALAIQACTVAQASVTITLPTATFNSGSSAASTPGAPAAIIPNATTPSTSASGGNIGTAGQAGIVVGAVGEEAGAWFVKEGKKLRHHLAQDVKKLRCDTDVGDACGDSAADAIQELNKCHAVRNSAPKCFARICARLTAQPPQPGQPAQPTLYNASYIAAVNAVLGTTWTSHKTPGVTYTYAQSLGCTPPVGGAPAILPPSE